MKNFILIVLAGLQLAGCKKFLDAKPDQKLQEANTVDAVQALLDNETIMNLNNPGTGEISADNYYLTDAGWAGVTSAAQRNMYTWESDITLSEYPNHWSRLYDVVMVSNVAVESLEKIAASTTSRAAWNNAMGSALLFRAKSFFSAALLWAKPWDPAAAATEPGIPLRLNTQYEAPTVRASLRENFDQVIYDLKKAAPLLPPVPQHKLRPSRPAAWALLARVYLYMGNYDSAGVYAGKYLDGNSSLLNYNSLSAGATNPVPLYNTEVIFHTAIPGTSILNSTRARMDSSLHASYATNDLRRTIFFRNNGNGSYSWKGNYTQSTAMFNGVSTDEVYLVKAEVQARSGDAAGAMATLNSLLQYRWRTGTFVPLNASNAPTALDIVLKERRKELLFRGELRWMDLKRLNRVPGYQQTLYRKINGQDYQLPPGSNRYALPIPQSVIDFSGIAQNPR